jgi:hypothetical protein
VGGIVLVFGPISDATGNLNPPPVEDVVQAVISVGMLAAILLILFGYRLGALLGAMCAAAGMGIGVADTPQVGSVGTAELAVFSVLLAASLCSWHVGGQVQALARVPAPAAEHNGVVSLRRYKISRHHPRLQIQGLDRLIGSSRPCH